MTRLWVINESKKVAKAWNVKAFFSITQGDVAECVIQLNNLKMTNHTLEIEKGGLGVHVQVCALMRAKLVSEISENFKKLKVNLLRQSNRDICKNNRFLLFLDLHTKA